MLRDELDRALRRYDYGKLTDADLGIELLRISNELATESKRLRAAGTASALIEARDALTAAGARIDPAAVMASIDGASEVTPSGGAEALPAGWRRTRPTEANCQVDYEHVDGVTVWGLHALGWSYCCHPPYGICDGTAPTMLQAMCAALGIAIEPFAPGGFRAWIGEDWHFAGTRDADVCARKALERLHARQQPAPAAALRQEADEIRKAARELTAPMHRADDACKCTYRPDGHRDVSRFCPLHGASWQTLAEQRSELHDDGTPRAGCAVCLGTPELDARERGLRG
jgi:hypothetical protein